MKESRSCREKRVGDEGFRNWRWIVEELCRGGEELLIMKTNRSKMLILMIHRHVSAVGAMLHRKMHVSIGKSTGAAITNKIFALRGIACPYTS